MLREICVLGCKTIYSLSNKKKSTYFFDSLFVYNNCTGWILRELRRLDFSGQKCIFLELVITIASTIFHRKSSVWLSFVPRSIYIYTSVTREWQKWLLEKEKKTTKKKTIIIFILSFCTRASSKWPRVSFTLWINELSVKTSCPVFRLIFFPPSQRPNFRASSFVDNVLKNKEPLTLIAT